MIVLFISWLIFILFTKPKPGYLNCGLWGLSSNRVIDERMLEKLKILGFFNQQRGTDSCGYYIGDKIAKGIDKEREWFNFAVDGEVQLTDKPSHVFIGHTRKATYGTHSAENAHPFNINDRLIIAHNGTIENAFSLCAVNDIDTKHINVDSLGLGYLIDKLGFSILEKYKGAAALLMCETKNPETLLIFHGKSKAFRNAADSVEERPLYYLEAEEGIYVSSIKGSLEWINGTKDEEKIHTVPYNRVIAISKGQILEAKMIINREEANFEPFDIPVVKSSRGADYLLPVKVAKKSSKEDSLPAILPMWETYPKRALITKGEVGIFYYQGRYWSTKEYDLCKGVLHINKKGKLVPLSDLSQTRVATCFFFRGIMIKGEAQYRHIQQEIQSAKTSFYLNVNSPDKNFAQFMSHYSKYPITNIEKEAQAVAVNRDNWWIDGKYADAKSITPVFSDRNYKFRGGKLVNITGRPADAPFFNEVKSSKKPLISIINPEKSLQSVYNMPAQVTESATLIARVYDSEEQAEEFLDELAKQALHSYAEDVCIEIMRTAATEELIEKVVSETILTAIYTNRTIEEVMEPQLQSAINYVYDVYEDSLEEEQLEEEATQSADGEAPEEALTKIYEPQTDAETAKILDLFSEYSRNDDDDEALGDTEDILRYMEDIKRKISDLSVLNSSPFAMDLHREVTMYTDNTLLAIKELGTKHKMAGIVGKVKKVIDVF